MVTCYNWVDSIDIFYQIHQLCAIPFVTNFKAVNFHLVLSATGFGRKDIVEYLIDHGAKVDAQDDGMHFTTGCENLSIQGILCSLKIYS